MQLDWVWYRNRYRWPHVAVTPVREPDPQRRWLALQIREVPGSLSGRCVFRMGYPCCFVIESPGWTWDQERADIERIFDDRLVHDMGDFEVRWDTAQQRVIRDPPCRTCLHQAFEETPWCMQTGGSKPDRYFRSEILATYARLHAQHEANPLRCHYCQTIIVAEWDDWDMRWYPEVDDQRNRRYAYDGRGASRWPTAPMLGQPLHDGRHWWCERLCWEQEINEAFAADERQWRQRRWLRTAKRELRNVRRYLREQARDRSPRAPSLPDAASRPDETSRT